jgi:hypothetical protein
MKKNENKAPRKLKNQTTEIVTEITTLILTFSKDW